MTLNKFQFEFCQRALQGNLSSTPPHLKKYAPREQAARLSIYRNNIFSSLVEVLANTYPATKIIIGATLFRHTAKLFIERHPPQNAVMLTYGAGFDSHIASYPPTQQLLYLSNLAELELAHHQAYYAADAEPLAPDYFAELDIDTLSNSIITPHPSAALITAPYGVYTLWQHALEHNCLPDEFEYNVTESVLIVRPHYNISSYLLSEPQHHFLQLLLQKKTIGHALSEAITLAESKQVEFNPAEAVQLLIASGLATNLDQI